MGRSYRARPKKLGAKLKQIRLSLELTQEEMVKQLAVKDEPLYSASISQYESGKREPPLLVLLRYAELYGCTMEDLVKDKVKLDRR
ncbi:MAG TPA: helix-turn-helix transcriptional regulator [Pyrinomonadaceae bacterium]|nr:helix-turn-helix transcriptional regulator [Pyrinomonadaceae bacterium]